MRKQWIARAELQELARLSVRRIEQKARTGELTWRHSKTSAKNGRPAREFLVESLPGELQAKLLKSSLALGCANPEAPGDAIVPALPDGARALTPAQEEKANERFAIIKPMLDLALRRERPHVRELCSLDEMAAQIASEHGKSLPTIWRWYRRFRKGSGRFSLADKQRADAGTSRFFARYPKAAELVQACFLRDRLSVQLTVERLHKVWPTLYNQGSKPPSYSTVRQFLERLPKPVTILAREGSRAYDEKCSPYLSRRIEAVRPNQVWVSDHCQHDVWVRNDGHFPGENIGRAIRPWLTAIIDMRSRKVVGAVWSANPSSDIICSALRIAVVECGLPQTFYTDNGKDFVKLSPAASGVLARVNIEHERCLPRHPQSKLIESWFATMHKRFDAQWGDFYCGSSPARRSDACNKALELHKRWVDGKAKASPLPLASDFCQMAVRFIREDYNSEYRAHAGRGMDGHTPNEVFDRELPEAERRHVENPADLYELLWDRQTRRIMEGGTVQLFSERYEAIDPQSSAEMYERIGRDVRVACDPANLGEAIALAEDGRVIARLRSQRLVEHGPVSRDLVRSSLRQRRGVKRAIENYTQGIGASYETPIEALRRAAGLHPTIDSASQRGASSPAFRRPLRQLRGATAAVPQYTEDVINDLEGCE